MPPYLFVPQVKIMKYFKICCCCYLPGGWKKFLNMSRSQARPTPGCIFFTTPSFSQVTQGTSKALLIALSPGSFSGPPQGPQKGLWEAPVGSDLGSVVGCTLLPRFRQQYQMHCWLLPPRPARLQLESKIPTLWVTLYSSWTILTCLTIISCSEIKFRICVEIQVQSQNSCFVQSMELSEIGFL